MKIFITILIAITMCSCSTTKLSLNGVPVRKREMAVRKDELRIYVGAFIGGLALGYHFKDEFKK